MIAVFLAPVYILVNIYVVRWILRWAGTCFSIFQSRSFCIIFSGLYLLWASSLLTGFLIRKPLFLHRLLKRAGDQFLGFFIYISICILTLDFFRLLMRNIFHAEWTRKSYVFICTGSICGLLIFLLVAYGILHTASVRVKPYDITIEKSTEENSSLKLVLLADLHLGCSAGVRHTEKIVDRINRENPDIVCITGDIFDNRYEDLEDPDKLQDLFRSIHSSYGVYACLGNHDINEPILAGFTFRHSDPANLDDPRMKKFLEDSDIHLLEDETVLINNQFYLTGRKDPSRCEKLSDVRLSPTELTEGLDSDKPIFFMDHQPGELQESADAGVDLCLSGHTHDGQFFPGNLFMKFLWENPCGCIKKDRMYSIVTSGCGVWGPDMRIGTDNEICPITIRFT